MTYLTYRISSNGWELTYSKWKERISILVDERRKWELGLCTLLSGGLSHDMKKTNQKLLQVNPYYQCHAGNLHTKWCHRRDCSTRRRRNEIPQDQDSPPNEYLMHISAHAVSGQVTAGTFSVKVTVGGQTGIALIDTGSSSTFIDLYLAVTTTCHIQKKKSAKIAVAGGGQLTSGAIIADTAFCFLVFQRSGGAEEFLVEKGRALANPSIQTLEKKKPILRHLLPSVHIII